MKLYELEDNIKRILKNIIIINNEELFVVQVLTKDNFIKIVTDKSDHIVLKEDLKSFFSSVQIKDYIPKFQKKNKPKKMETHKNKLISLPQANTIITSKGSDLVNVLMANIQAVQQDPNYINQAKSINDSVKNIIEMAKVEIEMIKSFNV